LFQAENPKDYSSNETIDKDGGAVVPPLDKLGEKPAAKATGMITVNGLQKALENLSKIGDETFKEKEPKSAKKIPEKSAEKTAEKEPKKAAEKSAGKEKVTEKSAGKDVDKAAEKSAGKGVGKAEQKPAEKGSEKITEKEAGKEQAPSLKSEDGEEKNVKVKGKKKKTNKMKDKPAEEIGESGNSDFPHRSCNHYYGFF